jgi:hypothetical protein
MVNTTLPAPTRIPKKVLIMGWPTPKPTPKPVATLAVISPTARTLGARHASNVGLVVSNPVPDPAPSTRRQGFSHLSPRRSTSFASFFKGCHDGP